MIEVLTPWGPAQESRQIADGITFHSTKSHGGIELSCVRQAMVPGELRGHYYLWRGKGEGWYEKYFNWAIVALAFPQCFSPSEVSQAVHTVRGYCPWAEAYVGSPAGATVLAIAERYGALEQRQVNRLWSSRGAAAVDNMEQPPWQRAQFSLPATGSGYLLTASA